MMRTLAAVGAVSMLVCGAFAQGVQRPQTPEAPFPYGEREVAIGVTDDSGDEITLAGTLTLPEGEGPFAAVVLLTGSGAQDRDEEIFGHRPFKLIADRLTRAGIAVLRCDDRGVGGSSGTFVDATTSDFGRDANAKVRWLREQAGIDPERVGLLGHSEGSVSAFLAARDDQDIAFVVSIAGPGAPGRELLVLQMRLLLEAQGVPPERVERISGLQQEMLDLIVKNASVGELKDAFRALATAQMALQGLKPNDDMLDQIVAGQIRTFAGEWGRELITLDPSESAARVSCPVLLVGGTLDLQVPPGPNITPLVGALLEGGCEDLTVRVYPRLNHLMQPARTGTIGEYQLSTVTMDERVLGDLVRWFEARFVEARVVDAD
ncbi:MAG: alpha/beta fold hydrolase [Planctomycetota bacterium]